MRTSRKILLVSSTALMAGLWSGQALAQKDVNPKLPNVLLLIDSSGSLEYLLDNPDKLPGDSVAPNSACNGSPGVTSRTRWANLVTALTGTISDQDFACRAVVRDPTPSSPFMTEFSLYGAKPYDAGYYLPFHRIMSNGCAYGAGILPTNGGGTWHWYERPGKANPGQAKDWAYRDASGNEVTSCNFIQAQDGLLDAFRGLVRFGLMTLDSAPDPGTGSDSPGNVQAAKADMDTGNRGQWSYFDGWLTANPPATPVYPIPAPNTARPAAGYPTACTESRYLEVGARNPAAPPWEGALVPFGDWHDDAHIGSTNDQIQMTLLTMRPYGASPIAGLFDDVKEFLFTDDVDAAFTAGKPHKLGPKDDPYWQAGCRSTYVILLSDGMPNLDLRSNGVGSGCDTAGTPAGSCPYDLPTNYMDWLATQAPANQRVKTFIVGYTKSDINAIRADLASKGKVLSPDPAGMSSCDDLTFESPTAVTYCQNPAPELRGCCNLQKMAHAGGTQHAYFGDTGNQLKQSLSAVLSAVVGGATDRTWPVYMPAGNRPAQGASFQGAPSASYQFAASFKVNSPAASGAGTVGSVMPALWGGKLLRQRTTCPTTSNTPTPVAPSTTDGDDYGYNLDTADAANPRHFMTVIGDTVGGVVNSDNTMRPFIGTTDDGLGTPYAPLSSSPGLTDETSFPSLMSTFPAAFGMPSTTACKQAFGPTTTDAQCVELLMKWEIGVTNTLPAGIPRPTRNWVDCPVACSSPINCPCSKLGAIFHSTPAVAGPPNEYLRDDTYSVYANSAAAAGQPTVLYTATMDGQLHAFKVQANDPADSFKTDHSANNELWSFFPPAVLQHLLPNYNAGGVPLLDGAPVIADVPGTASTNPIQYGRSSTTNVKWHRVLLASGGAAGGFYYALDITDPTSPRFLWQLSRDSVGVPLFGSYTPTPAIAIVNLNLNGELVQLPVAILPGGGTGTQANNCSPSPSSPINATYSSMKVGNATNTHLLSGVSATAPSLRCWDMTKNANRSSGNSLVVARLDTGEVLGYFLGAHYTGAPRSGNGGNVAGGDDTAQKLSIWKDRAFDGHFTAPVTGVPVPFPGVTGQVSDRVYVGDADGLLWRLDMGDPDIKKWSVNLAWDAYVSDNTAGQTREGIGIAPLVTRDEIGNPIILVATGDQDVFQVQQTTNHVWSLTEEPSSRNVSPNWHIALPSAGARVTGPMALFNGALFFSTYLPAPANASVCAEGKASVWGVDYVLKELTTTAQVADVTPVTGWPKARFPTTTGTAVYGRDADTGTIIMGVSLTQTPTCDISTSTNDGYFGSHTSLSSVSGSSYQISWQTGAGPGLNNGTWGVSKDASGVQSVTAPPPGLGTRVDSWASIVE